MKWFKHDSDANMDAKLQEVLLDYGLEGYGLYWYCVELIVNKINLESLTFELEHDARIIARNTGSTTEKVQSMMQRFVKLGLFENSNGNITCLKIAKRLDQSMTSNPNARKMINKIKDLHQGHDAVMTNHDGVMTESGFIMQEEKRREEIRREENNIDDPTESSIDVCTSNCPHQQIIDIYHEKLPTLRKVRSWNKTRKGYLKSRWREDEKRQDLDWWKKFFDYVSKSDFLMGKTDKPFDCDFEWLIRPTNFVKVIEGKYENRAKS